MYDIGKIQHRNNNNNKTCNIILSCLWIFKLYYCLDSGCVSVSTLCAMDFFIFLRLLQIPSCFVFPITFQKVSSFIYVPICSLNTCLYYCTYLIDQKCFIAGLFFSCQMINPSRIGIIYQNSRDFYHSEKSDTQYNY